MWLCFLLRNKDQIETRSSNLQSQRHQHFFFWWVPYYHHVMDLDPCFSMTNQKRKDYGQISSSADLLTLQQMQVPFLPCEIF